MNRLAKKCVVASAVLHGTLALTLLLVSGFTSSVSQPSAGGEITIFEAPAEAAASIQPVKARTSTEQEHVIKPNADAARTPRTVPVVRTPGINLVETTRFAQPTAKPDGDDGAAAQKSLATAIASIRNHASGSVNMGSFGENSGMSFSQESFEQTLKRVYFNNWQQPADAASDEAVVKVSVTVARDGTVMSASITKSSGDTAVDRSVERLLKEVTHIAPFPSGSKEAQRTYPLSFSLKAKHSLG